MKITNKNNFPDYVVEWLKSDDYDYDYDPNTLSATTLMSPARVYALKNKHWEDLEIDVTDLIASRYGTAIHDSVEKVGIKNAIQEIRFKTLIQGKKITGKFDLMIDMDQEEHKLVDVKSTSVWTYIYGSKDEEYIKQLSIYRYLARKNGYNVGSKADIFMIFTDWSAAKARNDSDYPQTRIKIKPIDLWTDTETEEYIKTRISALNEALINLPECTEDDLWQTKTKYAVMKTGRKSAVKLFDVEEEANKQANENKDYFVEIRPGKAKRCNYCSCRPVCDQFKELQTKGLID